MEKTSNPGDCHRPHAYRKRRGHFAVLLILAASLLTIHRWSSINSSFQLGPHDLPTFDSPDTVDRSGGDYFGFNWSRIDPSTDLKYTPCYTGVFCARLSVPLDWFNGTNPEETVSIAVVKVPAQVPITDARYGGPIFINPGGPGGSGTLFAAFGGQHLQFFTDTATPPDGKGSEDDRYHDIIGFDPRGVGATTPSAYCFDDDDYRLLWLIRLLEEGHPGSSNAALGRLLSLHRAQGASCNQRVDSGSSILNYMSTAAVARDMLELATKEDEWRQKQSTALRSTAR